MTAMGGAYFGARFGPLGAAAGGLIGLGVGAIARTEADESNMDLAFRRERHQTARENYDRAKKNSRSPRFYAGQERALRHQTALLRKATAAAVAGRGKGSVAAVAGEPFDLASGGAGGGGGRSGGGRSSSNDALRDQQRIDDATRDLQLDELRARQELTVDIKDRGVIAQQILELEQQGERAQIEHQAQLGDLVRTEADKRLASLAIVHTLEKEKLIRNEEYELLDAQLRRDQSIAQMAEDRLQLEADLSRTARERREIENRILDLRLAEQRKAAQRILDDPLKGKEDKDEAGRTLLHLDKTEPLLREQARRRTMGPMESFLDSVPRQADEVNEALEGVATGGVQSLVDGLADVATGARGMGSMFKQVAREMIADLIRIQLRALVVRGIMSVLGLGGGGMSAGGIASKSAAMSLPKKVPGLARGGIFPVGGAPGVDTNLLSINGQPRARVSASEHIAVIPNNKGGGRSSVFQFDMRGAITTPELLNQVNRQVVAGGIASAEAGAAKGASDVYRRARRRMPG